MKVSNAPFKTIQPHKSGSLILLVHKYKSSFEWLINQKAESLNIDRSIFMHQVFFFKFTYLFLGSHFTYWSYCYSSHFPPVFFFSPKKQKCPISTLNRIDEYNRNLIVLIYKLNLYKKKWVMKVSRH